MTKQQIMAGVAVILLLAAAVRVIQLATRKPQPSATGMTFSRAIGGGIARQTAALLQNQGTIVVIAAETKTPEPILEAQQRSFLEALAKTGVTVKTVEKIEFGRLRMETALSVPLDFYTAVAENHSGVDAIISLVGAPALKSNAGAGFPKTIAFVENTILLDKAFAAGALFAAIIPSDTPSEGVVPTDSTAAAWFDKYYRVVTAENVTSIPPTPPEMAEPPPETVGME